MRRTIITLASAFLLVACGYETGLDYAEDVVTQSPPTVSRIEPSTGTTGTTISIYGFGFSTAVPSNIVVIGDQSVSAETYELLDNPTPTEIERLTATVPDGLAVGESSVVVVVYDNVSNADVTFTVTP